MKEIEVVIDTEEIGGVFYEQLIERGYVPKREEIEDLADITFEYLLEKCMIDEVLMKRMNESNDGHNSSFLLLQTCHKYSQ